MKSSSHIRTQLKSKLFLTFDIINFNETHTSFIFMATNPMDKQAHSWIL